MTTLRDEDDDMNNKIPKWAKPKLVDLKKKADKIWHYSDSTHYCASVSEWEGRLAIELGPKDHPDVPESYYLYSVGYVTPNSDKTLSYVIRKNDEFEDLSCWEELVIRLKDDLEEYNQIILNALRKNLEKAIDSLPG